MARTKRSAKIVKQVQVLSGVKVLLDIKRKYLYIKILSSVIYTICYNRLCNACGLRYARLIAKNERLQGPKEEDVSLLKLKNNTTLKK